MKPGRRRVLGGMAAVLALAGCGLTSPRAIREPPEGFDRRGPRPPVVFIHGAFGARLRDRASGRELWPIGARELLLSDYAGLELPLDPDSGEALPDAVEAFELFEEAGNLEFYGSLIEALEQAGGYRQAVPGSAVTDDTPRLYAYLYDWRRDFAEAARGLESWVGQLRRDHGDPALRVDLVVHSSGGLLARYFLLYGAAPVPAAGTAVPSYAGVPMIRRVVAIGVPEIGIATAARALIEGESVGLNRIWPSTLATCHAAFQLLPHGEDAWLLDGAGRPLPVDALDFEVWREHRLSVFDPWVRERARHEHGGGRRGRDHLALLERAFALRLARALDLREALRAGPLPRAVPYHVIAGDCRGTLGRLVLERHGERRRVTTTPSDIRWPRRGVPYARLMLEPGDGTVTRASARARPRMPVAGRPSFPHALGLRDERFVCASHNQLVVNHDCQRALLRALGG